MDIVLNDYLGSGPYLFEMRSNVIPFRRAVRKRPSDPEKNNFGFYTLTVFLCAGLFSVIFFTDVFGPSEAAVGGQDGESANFSYCFGPIRRNCVVDGDTIWYQGRKIRIADINTPELGDAGCDYERQLGAQAKARLTVLLNDGAFSLESIDRDEDRFGRALRIVTRDGQSLGDILVAEGLAEPWQGYRRDWC